MKKDEKCDKIGKLGKIINAEFFQRIKIIPLYATLFLP
ncbi:hypothetical protein M23134_06743 [Microscilla marina ATCC 23134]|uniref:Uncharacterized protein n=1 Tax=Microscilla marina ATCC 23134 TaxID=313606 RepID=A1ZXS3_MICM2|nr:hypothetical protein M23134_06743 [Microscilla marina ATCC 23134]